MRSWSSPVWASVALLAQFHIGGNTYWHYEMFAVGGSGAKPFASKMIIRGNTWTETGEDGEQGKKGYDRISYVYTSTTMVKVKIEVSPDQKRWKTTLEGTGVRQP